MSDYPIKYKTDFSEAMPPCTKCRHADICDQPPTCHSLRYYTQTGKRITPPRVNPCDRREEQLVQPTPTPKDRRGQHGISDEVAREIEQFEREMQEGCKG